MRCCYSASLAVCSLHSKSLESRWRKSGCTFDRSSCITRCVFSAPIVFLLFLFVRSTGLHLFFATPDVIDARCTEHPWNRSVWRSRGRRQKMEDPALKAAWLPAGAAGRSFRVMDTIEASVGTRGHQWRKHKCRCPSLGQDVSDGHLPPLLTSLLSLWVSSMRHSTHSSSIFFLIDSRRTFVQEVL